jgi:multiple sugar transport system permease protein
VTSPHRSRARTLSAYLFLLPYLLLFAAFLLLPLIYGLGLSFMQYEMVSPLPLKFIGFANYAEAFHDSRFWHALWATLRFVLMCVPATLVIAMLLALALDAVSPKRMGIYRLAIFLPTMVTISVAALVWRWFFNSEFGVFNSLLSHVGLRFPWIIDTRWAMPSLVLMTVWWTVGAPTLILLAGLRQIPPAYHEAAALDGATGVKRFFLVTLPLLRPVLLFVLVTYTIGAFQVFGQPFLITSGGPEMSTRVLVQYIYETAFNSYRMGYGAAMSWLLFLVIAATSVLVFRTMKEDQ